MDFIKDITESRMYRRLGQLTGKSVDEICVEVFWFANGAGIKFYKEAIEDENINNKKPR